jgi:hypothetical protein
LSVPLPLKQVQASLALPSLPLLSDPEYKLLYADTLKALTLVLLLLALLSFVMVLLPVALRLASQQVFPHLADLLWKRLRLEPATFMLSVSSDNN